MVGPEQHHKLRVEVAHELAGGRGGQVDRAPRQPATNGPTPSAPTFTAVPMFLVRTMTHSDPRAGATR
jgi:hypothetical protein